MDFENTLGRYIGRLNYLMSQELNRVLKASEAGITSDQFRLLTHLWNQDGLTQQVLSGQTGRDRGSITRMIDILEKKGIITRIPDQTDRRVNLIYLTKQGRELQPKAIQCAQQVLDKITTGFSEEEKQTFKNLLKKSVENLKEK